MGKVFSWYEIKERRVPTAENFVEVRKHIGLVLNRCESVRAALMFGSVARGDATVRSDIDLVVLYDDKNARVALGEIQDLSSYASSRNVSINYALCDIETAKTRLHHFGPSFIEHLRRSLQKGLIKGKPLEYFAPSVETRGEIENYLRFKMSKLQNSWGSYTAKNASEKAAALTKFYEAPLHVARKVLAWHEQLLDDSKAGIQKHYDLTMHAELGSALWTLVNIDHEYTLMLAAHIERPHEENYNTELGYLEEHVPLILEFVRLNLQHLNRARH